ncbi:40-kDa huntingtin-associated protein [Microplitis demolitor]|uniref:40-kDa huntingtin-associated protein n=1 Tax=Microplitis demolitor TaxID=69319 RepID=UPI0004CD7986|nr:40-kDa huntingtin-associated protein [Microplitis demolitor]
MSDLKEPPNLMGKYHLINNKLKKRFMKNPNYSEISEEFIALAKECEQNQAWQYAGLCYTAASKCYHTMGITTSEINSLMQAGRQYLVAEKQNANIGCPSMGQENIIAATKSFLDAAERVPDAPEFNVLVSECLRELASFQKGSSACDQLLKKSISMFATVESLDELILNCIEQESFVEAFNAINEQISLIESIERNTLSRYRHSLHDAEINRLLLILIMYPTCVKVQPAHRNVLDKFIANEENTKNCLCLSDDEFILLQSLIFACQSEDIGAIVDLETELWDYLNANQKCLLRMLVRIVTNEC